ncbi:MAG: methyltransferase domain-containing protein [Euryarchaeota archaeon]|nr:methyltransferase domain-containing protein [Euryarchaeota archaeon]
MKIMFELSKEQPTIPTAEIFSCLHAENIEFSVLISNEDVLVIEATKASKEQICFIANRLAFSSFVDEFLFSGPPTPETLVKIASQNPIKKQGSIAITYKKRSQSIDSQSLVQALGVHYAKERQINLSNPDITIRLLVTDPQIYVGIQLAEIDKKTFEQRKASYRPFFSPISLHPKVARALVNLSQIKKDDMVLDPFCGTGGIILEAGLLGARVIGSDVEHKMIDGCKKTLEFYNVHNYQVFCSDIGDIKKTIHNVDAVVTDFPYAKATTTKGESIPLLYERAFDTLSQVLKPGGRAVIGMHNEEMSLIGKQYLSFVESHPFRVHRSLTRYFVVFEN